MADVSRWVSDRAAAVEVSGIRKVFDLARSLRDPVNLSIGQPHFPVPEPVKAAAKAAIDADQNGYTVTRGDAAFVAKLQADVDRRFPGHGRDLLVTSGTSGGLLLALLAVVNPGDEVIVLDPYFVSYPNMVAMAGGVTVKVDTYPTFDVDPDKVKAAITPRTKVVMLCSPANPTGVVLSPEAVREVVAICRERNVLVISDEIYREFYYGGGPFRSPGESDPDVLVVEGFGKTYGITGWRLGYAHGPKALIEEMVKLQQLTFVCAPSIVQHAGRAAMDFDINGIVSDYQRKRDLVVAGLRDRFEFETPGGAFYLFPGSPRGSGTEFVGRAIERNLLLIPGGTFSQRDTHFRISYAAADDTLHRGIEILNALAAD